MARSGRSVAAAAIVAMLFGTVAPAHAEEQSKGRSAGTVVKWTLIGVAAGAGIGFLSGFNAYDDATYAESRIAKATLAGGAIGGAAGFGVGLWRSQPSASHSHSARSLWRPDAKMPMRPERTWGASGPAPTLRSLSHPLRIVP